MVSWCLGHLAEYAAPEYYDECYKSWRFDDLPILPEEWKLLVSEDKKAHFNILRKLLRSKDFDYVVNACDAGREGEAIFRRVYGLAGSKLPVKRLWISSMEDSAIQQGFDSLKDGAEYDNLFATSECRAKADWLIGMNGTRAFTKKYGRRQTIGRVQTPTLAMLTERQNEIQNFVKEPYYKVEITGNGIVAESERMAQEQDADIMQAACDGQCAVVGSIERKRKEQSAPKLYDLTTLQREANRYYGFTASQTLKIVQELYEEKLVTYPRTDSQYITEDMQQTMADLLKHYGGEADGVKQVVNNKKVTDHHAILPTLESCKRGSSSLSGDKEKVFALIVWKMQQAVQPPYIYEDVLVTVCCQDRKFTAKYKNVLQAGHTAMPVPCAEQEKSKDMAFPKKLEQGEVIPVVSAEKKQGFTSPPKAFTEDTLLSAMESAGNKEFEKDTEKKGLGTPATRAAILEKLVSSGYVERKGKQILPSAEGVTAIANIPDYLKSASMTAEWENELLRMERGETKPADFMQGIGGLLERMLADLRQIPTVQESPIYNKVSIGNCPVCGKSVCEGKLNFYCSDRDCKFALWKESKYLSGMKKTLTKKMATDLLKKGRTYAKDFYSAKKDKGYRCFSGKAPFIESEKIFREILSALEKEKMQAARIDRVLDLNPEKVKQCMDAGLLQYRKKANEIVARLMAKDDERTAVYREYEQGSISLEQVEEYEHQYQVAVQKQEADFKKVMLAVNDIEKAFSHGNPWLMKFRAISIPETLERAHLKEWLDHVWIVDFEQVEVILQESEWKRFFPEEWLNNGEEDCNGKKE